MTRQITAALGAVRGWRLAHPLLSTTLLFAGLTLAATYPIVRHPASYAYFSHADAQLNMWIMAWDAHALRHDPANLFNTNIFYPQRGTLAYSETLLGYLPVFGPILWLNGSPVLAFNAVLLFSFVFSGMAMYLLARYLTGRQWPAVVAGIVYAFAPYRFVHVPQIQLEAMEWLPLSFLAMHAFVDASRGRHLAWLAASVVMCTLCCVYYGIFVAIGLAVGFVALALVEPRARQPRTLAGLFLAAVVAAVVLAPLFGAYLRVSQRSGLERSISEIRERSADLHTYLSSSAPLHQAMGLASAPTPNDYLFPGFAALLLAALGIAGARRKPALMAVYLAVGVVGLDLSFGPDGAYGVSIYTPLHAVLPVLDGLRQVSRFGILVLFAVAIFAALGCAALEDTVLRRRPAWMFAVAAVVFLEVLQAPLRYDRPDGDQLVRVPPTPEVYTWIAQQPGTFSILELPMPEVGFLWQNAPYVYWSTTHWRPLVNGYSGFAPAGYTSFRRIVSRLPDDLSRQSLSLRNVRFVIVHWTRFRSTDIPLSRDRLMQAGWLRLARQFADVDVFEVDPIDGLSDR